MKNPVSTIRLSARPRFVGTTAASMAVMTSVFLLATANCRARSAPPYVSLFCPPTATIPTADGAVDCWVLEPSGGVAFATVYFVCGIPDSALGLAALAAECTNFGCRSVLINPPGHGKSANNPLWHFGSDQYRKVVSAVLASEDWRAGMTNVAIVAHSAGCEWTFQAMLGARGRDAFPVNNVIFINPWLPSVANRVACHPLAIPWGRRDTNVLSHCFLAVQLFGPCLRNAELDRLFHDRRGANEQCVGDFVAAQKRLTGGWFFAWPFHRWFVKELRGTTAEQDRILRKLDYEFPPEQLADFRKVWASHAKMLVLSSTGTNDVIMNRAYKDALKQQLELKLAGMEPRFEDIPGGGHMLQVQRTSEVACAIRRFLTAPR